jgi:hypothetical protein
MTACTGSEIALSRLFHLWISGGVTGAVCTSQGLADAHLLCRRFVPGRIRLCTHPASLKQRCVAGQPAWVRWRYTAPPRVTGTFPSLSRVKKFNFCECRGTLPTRDRLFTSPTRLQDGHYKHKQRRPSSRWDADGHAKLRSQADRHREMLSSRTHSQNSESAIPSP